MFNRTILTAGAAAVLLAACATASFAQVSGEPVKRSGARAGVKARPLTVNPAAQPAPIVNPITGVANAVATPFNSLGAPGAVVGGAITGAGTIATAPFNGLFGTAPSISGTPAPPLPIKARYANTGAVTATFDEGFAQDVPVDASGPIYQIDNTGRDRTVTPFSLLAFPVTAATYAVTSPLRPVVRP